MPEVPIYIIALVAILGFVLVLFVASRLRRRSETKAKASGGPHTLDARKEELEDDEEQELEASAEQPDGELEPEGSELEPEDGEPPAEAVADEDEPKLNAEDDVLPDASVTPEPSEPVAPSAAVAPVVPAEPVEAIPIQPQPANLADAVMSERDLYLSERTLEPEAAEPDPLEATSELPVPEPIAAPAAPGLPRVGFLHEQGARDYQEDNFFISDVESASEQGLLVAVADGMGGMSDGALVSSAALSGMLERFTGFADKMNPQALLLALLKGAVEDVSEALGPSRVGRCGSTLVMALFKGSQLHLLNVGDSRAYLLRAGGLIQLSRDQIYLCDLALRAVNGRMTLRDAFGNAEANALANFVGMGELHGIDLPVSPLQLLPGDTVALMSDGVYRALSADELITCLEGGDPAAAAERLRAAVARKAFPTQDNYTAVVVGIDAQ